MFPRFLLYIKNFFAYLTDLFSVKICLNTLFYPWKRDKISYDGLAIKEKFEAFSMNMVSRGVGALIKLTTILVYIIAMAATFILTGAVIFIWLLYPLIFIFLIILSIANV